MPVAASVGELRLTRFWAKVAKGDGCWLWTGATTRAGYGRIKERGTMQLAHRVAYELMRGPIPNGMTLDHLCRNTSCVNPDHMEAVTLRDNVLRNSGPTAANAVKTECHKGHPLLGQNLLIRRDGRRRCRTCERATQRRLRTTDAYRASHATQERERRMRKATRP